LIELLIRNHQVNDTNPFIGSIRSN